MYFQPLARWRHWVVYISGNPVRGLPLANSGFALLSAMVLAVCGHQTPHYEGHDLCNDCILSATGFLCNPNFTCQVCFSWTADQWEEVLKQRDKLEQRRLHAAQAKITQIWTNLSAFVPRRARSRPPSPARFSVISDSAASAATAVVRNLFQPVSPRGSDVGSSSSSSLSVVDCDVYVNPELLVFTDTDTEESDMGKKVSVKEDSRFDAALAQHRQSYLQSDAQSTTSSSKRHRTDSAGGDHKRARDDKATRRKVKPISPRSQQDAKAASTSFSPPPAQVKTEPPVVKRRAKHSSERRKSAETKKPPPVYALPSPGQAIPGQELSGSEYTESDQSSDESDDASSVAKQQPEPITFSSILHMIRSFSDAELVTVEPSAVEEWSATRPGEGEAYVALSTLKSTILPLKAWAAEFAAKDMKEGVKWGRVFKAAAMKPKTKAYRAGDKVLPIEPYVLPANDFPWLGKAPATVTVNWSDMNALEVMIKQLIRVNNFLAAANTAGHKADESDFDKSFRMALHISRQASLRETQSIMSQLLGAVVTIKRDAVLAVSDASLKTGMKKALRHDDLLNGAFLFTPGTLEKVDNLVDKVALQSALTAKSSAALKTPDRPTKGEYR